VRGLHRIFAVTKERIKYDDKTSMIHNFDLKFGILCQDVPITHTLFRSESVKTRIAILQLFSRKTIQHATKTFAHRIRMYPMKTSFGHVPETGKYRLQLCFHRNTTHMKHFIYYSTLF